MGRSTGEGVRVLCVDDERAHAELTAEWLERAGYEVVVETDPTSALERIGDVDCVVSDYDMPTGDGLALLERVREDHPDLPFLLFTGKGSEEVASDAISAGVTDYLQKGGTEQYRLLARRVSNALETAWPAVGGGGDATLETDADLGVLHADRERLVTLLENLLRNAVEHGSTSPRSRAREDAVEHGRPEVSIEIGRTEDGFYVADDGDGIPEDERAAVFEHGYTTAAGGTGVGLGIVRGIAEAHGWEVAVTEREAGGARFEIRGVDRA